MMYKNKNMYVQYANKAEIYRNLLNENSVNYDKLFGFTYDITYKM